MTSWVDKIWGRTRELVADDAYSRHELEMNAGSYCSLHYHQHRSNKFLVLDGAVEIVEMFGKKAVRTMLTAGNMYEVQSLVPHMFIVYASGHAIEEYFPDGGPVCRDDIIRLVEGGLLDINKLRELPECLLNQQLWNRLTAVS